MKLLASAAAAAMMVGVGGGAMAQGISNPAGTMRNFDVANLGPVLTDMGVQWEQRTGPDGQPFIVANINGYFLNIVPAACQGPNNTGCLGAQTFALNEAPAVNQQSINAFNLRYAFLSAGPLPSGFYLSRYDLADYGIARGNVQSSVGSFLAIAAVASQELAGGGQTVSAIGYAEDLAASHLNEASARAIGIEAGVNTGDAHLKEIKAAPEFVKALAASGAAAFNKIENVTKK
ncbi:MAG TPA: hypothetical protein DDZ68_14860 [Parvularcula sp.]|nr:hypothetical protein [Parvularcula sp.]HBS32270.1 hypothetical protein [Parvularcula sp.]